ERRALRPSPDHVLPPPARADVQGALERGHRGLAPHLPRPHPGLRAPCAAPARAEPPAAADASKGRLSADAGRPPRHHQNLLKVAPKRTITPATRATGSRPGLF